MNLTLDIGNTRIKWAQFRGNDLVASGHLAADAAVDSLPFPPAASCCLAAVSGVVPEQLAQLPVLSSDTPLPIGIDYDSRHTLGADRIADAVGAYALLGHGVPALIIDAGTCITVDYLSADGRFQGGAILPGLAMQFQALHQHTALLPLISLDSCDDWTGLTVGKTTAQSMQAGVLTATCFAIEQFIQHQRLQTPDLRVLLTGGDASRLHLQQAQCCPQLLHYGLNAIINHANS